MHGRKNIKFHSKDLNFCYWVYIQHILIRLGPTAVFTYRIVTNSVVKAPPITTNQSQPHLNVTLPVLLVFMAVRQVPHKYSALLSTVRPYPNTG